VVVEMDDEQAKAQREPSLVPALEESLRGQP